MNILRELENPIRLKITGRCNRRCFFCHKEGGMNIDDIIFSYKIVESIERLSEELNMHSIAVTGGEPLLYEKFDLLIEKLMGCKGINKFSITTNGTVFKSKNFWERLKKCGLYKVNISMPDILNDQRKKVQERPLNNKKTSIFENQLKTIKILNELEIEVKINVTVINDVLYTTSVLKNLLSEKDIKFDIVLLPNITNNQTYEYSQKIIFELCKIMQLKMTGIRKRRGTSDVIFIYENTIKQKIYIKTTRFEGKAFHLESICTGCNKKESCQEGFYGIRLEQIQGELYIRLCLYKSTPDVLLLIDDFWMSDAYNELRKLWI